MKANRWANPHLYPKYIPDNLPGPYTLSSIVIKPEQLFPGVIRVLSIIQEFAYPIEFIPIYLYCNKPRQVIQLETVIKVISIIFQGPDNPTVRINLININLKRAYRVIHNFICLIIILHYKYRYNILYMQINIPGLMKAQGHNPKGH